MLGVSIAAIALLASPAARADCANPDAEVKGIVYNSSAKVFQYCDGTNWRAMLGGRAIDPSLATLTDVDDGLAPAGGDALIYDSVSGMWVAGAGSGGGDNLGNHAATQNIQLGTHWLSGDGGNEGIYVDAYGKVGLMTIPDTRLHVATGSDATLAGGGFLTLGSTSGLNLALDSNEIMVRNNGVAATLYLNTEGGDVQFGGGRVINIATPSAPTDAATKGYVDGLTGASETDPQVNAVTNNQWCRGTGTQVTCDQAAPSAPTCVVRTFSSATKTATVSCQAGETMTGGGCSGVDHVVRSYPSAADTWTCSRDQNFGVDVHAICCTF